MIGKIFIVATAVAFSQITFGLGNPKVVSVSTEKSYVPIGFDDNDSIQVAVVGSFPSTCYKVGASNTEVDEQKKTIRILQSAYFYNGPCLRMLVPFMQVVNIGIAAAGNYTILDGSSGKGLGKLSVTRSTHAGPDDYLYAPVSDAFFQTEASGSKTLTLQGEFSDRCTSLKEVQVHYYSDVIVVQPIAEHEEPGRCEPVKTRFTKTVELDPALNGTYLLHVRSLNGQAINKLVDTAYVEPAR